MTTYYVDLVNGNDSNAGTSFATRKKTVASAITAGATAGDMVRVMASPAATDTGIQATWTNGSGTVTLASAVTLTVDNCETAWTAAANVTATANSTNFRQGSASASMAVAGAFTTGLIAYKALGSAVNFSGYQQLSFWIACNNAVAANTLTLSLCSDTAGAVPVNTITIPSGSTSQGGYWSKVVVDTGGALGSSIQSVALNALLDPGTVTIYLDNIIACKAPSGADSLTLRSLISKGGGEPWFTVEAINGTTVVLSSQGTSGLSYNANYVGKYWGTTQTTALYKREAIVIDAPINGTKNAGNGDVNSASNMLTISGGWNTTDMSTQVDRTYLRPSSQGLSCISSTFSRNQIITSFGCCDGRYGLDLSQSNYCNVTDVVAVGLDAGFYQNSGGPITVSMPYVMHCMNAFQTNLPSGDTSSFYCGQSWGLSNLALSNYFINDNTGIYVPRLNMECPEIRNYSQAVVTFGGSEWTLKNTAFYNTYRDLNVNGNVYAYNTTFSDATLATKIQSSYGGTVYVTKLQGDANSHGQYNVNWRILTATDQRHSASDVSWKLISSSNLQFYNYTACSLQVATVACPANETRTVSLWFRKDAAASAMRLRVKGGFVAGIPNDVIADMTVGANTWEQLSVSFTPTTNAVVPVFAEFKGANNTAGWVDDLAVS